MFKQVLFFWAIFRKNPQGEGSQIAKQFGNRLIYKYQSITEKDRLVVFILVISAILLFSFKTTSGQGQDTLLARALEGYIEETSAFVGAKVQPDEKDFFLSQSAMFVEEISQIPPNVSQESFLPYQSLVSIFDGGQRNQVVKYTVQPGDNLSQIANDFGVSINSLVWANNLKDSDYLSPGQEIKIPPVSGVIHTVKKGDSIDSIAKKYSAKEDEIIAFNGLPKDGSLQIGHEIVVPGGKIQVAGQLVSYSSSVRFARLPDLGGFFGLPAQGYNWGRLHGRNGVDVANICGSPIYAAAGGAVIAARQSGWNGGAGKYIKLSHGNEIYTLYAHLSRLLVGPNESIVQGQLIGLMGATGLSTGCHLHFEVHGARNPLARY